ncbi:hypothetical protein NN561_017168 [Cricetulus griseus]
MATTVRRLRGSSPSTQGLVSSTVGACGDSMGDPAGGSCQSPEVCGLAAGTEAAGTAEQTRGERSGAAAGRRAPNPSHTLTDLETAVPLQRGEACRSRTGAGFRVPATQRVSTATGQDGGAQPPPRARDDRVVRVRDGARSRSLGGRVDAPDVIALRLKLTEGALESRSRGGSGAELRRARRNRIVAGRPGFGVDQLRDDNLETYWQSDGSQPHLVNIQFRVSQ